VGDLNKLSTVERLARMSIDDKRISDNACELLRLALTPKCGETSALTTSRPEVFLASTRWRQLGSLFTLDNADRLFAQPAIDHAAQRTSD
jgi:hypothetical protein